MSDYTELGKKKASPLTVLFKKIDLFKGAIFVLTHVGPLTDALVLLIQDSEKDLISLNVQERIVRLHD